MARDGGKKKIWERKTANKIDGRDKTRMKKCGTS